MSEEKTPYLWSNGKIAMKCTGNDYTIGKPTVDDNGKHVLIGHCYCYDPVIAVKTLAKKVSNEEATELFEWLGVFAEIVEDLKKCVEG